MREMRIDFQAEKAIISITLIKDRTKNVCSHAAVFNGQFLINFFWRFPVQGQLVYLIIVHITFTDSICKNSRVRSHTPQSFFYIVAQSAGLYQRAVDVIEPDRLSQFSQTV